MENLKELRWAAPRSWSPAIVTLLPIWLLSVAIMAEGFLRPPVPVEVATASFVLAIATGIVLLWTGWMTSELLLYSLFPLLLLSTFDEITTTYKTPFIVLCALMLTAGIAGYQHYRSSRLRSLLLLAAAAVTIVMAWHAASSFWQMAGDLGYVRCFLDAHSCAPLTGKETPWWSLFFSTGSW